MVREAVGWPEAASGLRARPGSRHARGRRLRGFRVQLKNLKTVEALYNEGEKLKFGISLPPSYHQ